MNEKDVLKRSLYLFVVGCFLMGIVGILLHDVSYLLGLILGYVINVIVFYMIIYMSDGILKFSMSSFIVAVMFILKLVIYALGFYIAVKVSWIHIFGVFVGYMLTKLSIYYEGYQHRGGE